MTVQRDEREIARALRALTAAASVAVDTGATPSEILAAYEDGVATALDRRDTVAAAQKTIADAMARMQGDAA